MSVPYLSQADVNAWIEAKNKTTSAASSKIESTTSRIKGLLSHLVDQSIKIETKEGPIFVSKKALAYLSESEKKLSDNPSEQLSLRILAETKLTPLAIKSHETIPLLPEQRKPLETFLHVFDVHLKGDIAHTSIHKDSLTRNPKDESVELGVSTPEFVMTLVQTISSKPTVTVHRTADAHLPAELMPPEKAHTFITEFAIHPQQEHIPELVHALLSVPIENDPLAIRKWIKKICHHLSTASEQKAHILNDLLIEFERQSRSATKKADNCLSFHALSEAVFEEILGPKDHLGKRYYLTSALSLAEICKKPNLGTTLSLPMKEAVQFFCLLQENPHKDMRGSGIEQERILLEKAYREEGKPSLFEELTLLRQALEKT